MKTLLWIATVLFFLLSWWWYVCPHKQVCPFGKYKDIVDPSLVTRSTESAPEPSIKIGPITFVWASEQPSLNDNFASYRDSILNQLGDSDILEIMGGYFKEETDESSLSDLGLARAKQVRSLFDDLPDHRVDVKSALFQRDAGSERTRPFLATNLRRIINNESVKEVAGKMVINFPHASDEMLTNIELNEYLEDLVERLEKTDEKVLLVGHTDSSAGSIRNMNLGFKRANAIKNLLISKGLDSSRITTDSKGETAPHCQ